MTATISVKLTFVQEKVLNSTAFEIATKKEHIKTIIAAPKITENTNTGSI